MESYFMSKNIIKSHGFEALDLEHKVKTFKQIGFYELRWRKKMVTYAKSSNIRDT